MACPCPAVPPPIFPTPEERRALEVAGYFLARAGSATATLLLRYDGSGDAALASSVKEQYDSGAAVCRGVLESTADFGSWIARMA